MVLQLRARSPNDCSERCAWYPLLVQVNAFRDLPRGRTYEELTVSSVS
jgi:hypothetical protein